ncbi:MAG: hypothetical protein K1X28_01570 [Parachlamydiales bacterium]|nr:hypothetical protein [Parachlamydiales bacterium]
MFAIFNRPSVKDKIYDSGPFDHVSSKIIASYAGPAAPNLWERVASWYNENEEEIKKSAQAVFAVSFITGIVILNAVGKSQQIEAFTQSREQAYHSYVAQSNLTGLELSSLMERTCASVLAYWGVNSWGLEKLQFSPAYTKGPQECMLHLTRNGFFRWVDQLKAGVCKTAACGIGSFIGKASVLTKVPKEIVPALYRRFINCGEKICEAIVTLDQSVPYDWGVCSSQLVK